MQSMQKHHMQPSGEEESQGLILYIVGGQVRKKYIVSVPIMRCFRRQTIKATWVANEQPNAGTSLGFLYATLSIGFSLCY